MGLTLIGLATLVGAELCRRAGRRRVGRNGILDLSSGVLAHRPLASGGRHGLAQSIFQVGGNAGSAMGPLLAGGSSFLTGVRASPGSPGRYVGDAVLWNVGTWYGANMWTCGSSEAARYPGSVPPPRVAGRSRSC